MRLSFGLRYFISLLFLALLVVPLIPSNIFADDEEAGGELKYEVNTSEMTGFNLLLGKLYNEHRILYSLVVTLTMAFLGMLVAVSTDYVLRLLGIRKISKGH